MVFSTFFSKQARRPEGLFGRIVMRLVFDQGNAFLNSFASELISIKPDDRIIEIGSGTGKLIYEMASVARNKNKNSIAKGRVKIVEDDFDNMPYEKKSILRHIVSIHCLFGLRQFIPQQK